MRTHQPPAGCGGDQVPRISPCRNEKFRALDELCCLWSVGHTNGLIAARNFLLCCIHRCFFVEKVLPYRPSVELDRGQCIPSRPAAANAVTAPVRLGLEPCRGVR